MNRSSILTLTLLAVVFRANAWCFPWDRGGVMSLCKKPDKIDCVTIQSNDECVYLSPEYKSGFQGGRYSCRIYSWHNCPKPNLQGIQATVNGNGFDDFPFRVLSFKCPCIPVWAHPKHLRINR